MQRSKTAAQIIEVIRTNASRSRALACPSYAARNALGTEPTEFSASLTV
jgi:hypothetical protein